MNVVTAIKKFEHMLINDHQGVWSNLIMSTESGYEAFGEFEIKNTKHCVEVTVSHSQSKQFLDMRNAISWCVATKFKKYEMANEILFVDQNQRMITDDIFVSKALLKRMRDSKRRQIAQDKLNHKLARLAALTKQMAKCARHAKYLQIKGFNDEIERARRSTPNRKNISADGITPRIES